MKYGDSYIEKAFYIWFETDNFDETARIMRKKFKRCKTIVRQTIEKWHKSEQWEERAAELRLQARLQVDKDIVNERVALLKQYKELIQKAYETALRNSVKAKSFEGAIGAFNSMCKTYMELAGFGDRRLRNIDELLVIILEVVSEDESLSKVFQERIPFIKGKLKERVEELQN